ncbi:hypothetical protein B0T17DRAFT_529088, partial [Bombardia bombarda]
FFFFFLLVCFVSISASASSLSLEASTRSFTRAHTQARSYFAGLLGYKWVSIWDRDARGGSIHGGPKARNRFRSLTFFP